MSSGIWGAIKGLGTGVAENAKLEMSQKNELEQIDYRAMKEEALAHLRGEIDATNTAAANKQTHDFRTEELGNEAGFRSAEAVAADERKSTEARLGHKDEMELQELRNKGSLRVAEEGSGARGVQDRFEMKTQNGGEATGFADAATIYDKKARRQYSQNGDRYDVTGVTDEQRKTAGTPNQVALKMLYKAVEKGDEASINAFADQFKYLPANVLRALPSFMDKASGE